MKETALLNKGLLDDYLSSMADKDSIIFKMKSERDNFLIKMEEYKIKEEEEE